MSRRSAALVPALAVLFLGGAPATADVSFRPRRTLGPGTFEYDKRGELRGREPDRKRAARWGWIGSMLGRDRGWGGEDGAE